MQKKNPERARPAMARASNSRLLCTQPPTYQDRTWGGEKIGESKTTDEEKGESKDRIKNEATALLLFLYRIQN